jgi:ribosome maturation factor RimP
LFPLLAKKVVFLNCEFDLFLLSCVPANIEIQLLDQIEKALKMVTASELIEQLTPVVKTFSLDLDEVSISKSGNQRVLDITVDGDAGVNLDEVAAVSRAISEYLDASDVMGESPYLLEVGTRGVSSPLTKPVHWERNIGRLVNVAGDAINAIGRITQFENPNVTLLVDGKYRVININELSRAHIEVEFKKMPKESSNDDSDDSDDSVDSPQDID